MKKLVVTGEHAVYNVPEQSQPKLDAKTFIVCDIDTQKILFKKEFQPELKSNLINQGRPQFHPFGIASDEQYIYIASNDKIGKFDKVNYDFIETLNIPTFTNTHQILRHKDNLYVCHTSIDVIGLHDLKNNTHRYLKFPEWEFVDSVRQPINAYELDTVHVNSITVHDEKLYFCLHYDYRKQKRSEFGYLDLNNFKTYKLFEGGFDSHNVALLNNKLYSLSSRTGDLIEYDFLKMNKTSYNIVSAERIFLRGMQTYGNDLLIACSNVYGEYFHQRERIRSCVATVNLTTKKVSPLMFFPEMPFIMDIQFL